jgi:hypothetical protein
MGEIAVIPRGDPDHPHIVTPYGKENPFPSDSSLDRGKTEQMDGEKRKRLPPESQGAVQGPTTGTINHYEGL